MSKSKIKNILLIIILIAIATGLVLFTNLKVESSNGTFTLAELMATEQGKTSTSNYNKIMSRSVDNLLNYFVTESTSTTNRNIEPQTEYAFCVGEHNANGNTTWLITKVLDIPSLDNATYKDIYGNSATLSGNIYSKLAIYAYMQNVYKIEDYGYARGTTGYANSLDYLLPQTGKFEEVSSVTNPNAYTGISKDLITLENNYAAFVDKLKQAGNSIFEDGRTTELQNSANRTTYGPINIKLKNGLSATYTDVHKTYTNEYVGKFSTGVRVTLTVNFTDGTSEVITNSSSTYIKNSSGTKINPETFDWRSNFYIETTKSIEKIVVNYSYETYKARFVLLSGSYGEEVYANQSYGIFGGDKVEESGSFEITVDRGADVYLRKVDSSDSSKKLSGVVLQIFSGNTQIEELTTKSDGKTDKITLVEGTYTVKEVRNNNYGYKHAAYNGTFEVTREQVNAGRDIIIDVENTQELKDLTLNKEGKDSLKLSGVPFIVTIDGGTTKYIRIIDNSGNKVNNISNAKISETGLATSTEYGIQYVEKATDATIFVTDENGQIKIENLEVYANSTTKYKYTAIEQSNPNYLYKGKINAGESAYTLDLSETNTLTVNNTPEPGKLKIEKVDERDENIALASVDFKIMQDDKYIRLINEWGSQFNRENTLVEEIYLSETGKAYYGDDDIYYLEIMLVDDINQATTFRTGEKGTIEINNLEVYKDSKNSKYVYKIYEIATNNDYYEITESTVEATLIPDETVEKTIKNKQKYIDLSGYVWEDLRLNGKVTEELNNLYKDDEADANDIRVEGVTVRLKDKTTGSIVSNADNIECVTTTNSNGEYKFEKIEIEELSNYYVEFEYDGLTYTSVELHTDKENGSKAQEVYNDRTEFNNRYSEITSTFNNTDKTVIATTQEAGYTITQNSTEITNINLGIVKREQTDIAMSTKTDIQQVDVSINKANYSYVYGLRDKEENLNTSIDISVESNTDTYTREMYSNYVEYSQTLSADDSNRLKVYVTYKLIVQNDASTLYVSAKEIANYLDDDYTVIDSWLEDGTKVTWNTTSKYGYTYNQNGYKAIYTTDLENIKMNPVGNANSTIAIYLKVQVNDEVVLGLLNGDAILDNITEVNSYVSYYSDKTKEAGQVGNREGQIYGSIDKDSTPGNVEIGNEETYKEDDTVRSPKLKLTVKYAKGISGTVWNDQNVKTNEENVGNGILDSGESKIQNVKVELLNADTLEIADLYTEDGTKKAVTYTNENGNYQFIGIIPDNYITRFTYGTFENEAGETVNTTINGNPINIRDYKSTIVTSETVKSAINGDGNLNWYLNIEENRYSDAVDNLEVRESIEATRYGNIKESYTMYADTAKFKVGVEFTTTESASVDVDGNPIEGKFLAIQENMDFGIIERPVVDIELKKEISYVKVTLNEGTVLIEGDPRTQNITYTKNMDNNLISSEIDTELLQGATLELTYAITVTNNSQIDYDYRTDNGEYYKFGTISANAKMVRTTVTKLADYMDNIVEVNVGEGTDNPEWKKVELSDLRNNEKPEEAYISEEVYNELATGNYIILETAYFTDLERGETKTIELKACKLLAETDNIDIYNYTEILELGGDISRTVSKAIPGNYVPKTEPKEQDEDSIKFTIAPPTGDVEEHNTNILIISSIIGLVFVAVGLFGIVIIKKFVINKK